MTEDFLQGIPPLSTLESRFSFIRNTVLRENVTIYFRYIILLLAMGEEEKLDALRYSVYKDVIVYTASVVECILEYIVKEYVAIGKADEKAFGFSWHYSEISPINHDCVEFHEAKFCVAKKTKQYKWTAHELNFVDINSAVLKLKILDKDLHKKADDLRAKRNLIHLGGLNKSSNDYIKKADVQAALSDAHDIILKVEEVLKDLTK